VVSALSAVGVLVARGSLVRAVRGVDDSAGSVLRVRHEVAVDLQCEARIGMPQVLSERADERE